jgi:hypothetical protein
MLVNIFILAKAYGKRSVWRQGQRTISTHNVAHYTNLLGT